MFAERVTDEIERIQITDIRPGDELVDRFRISLGTVATVSRGAHGVVIYTVKHSTLPRHLSPYAPRGKNAGTVLRVKAV